jgi:phosphate transport system substrate-binding protein
MLHMSHVFPETSHASSGQGLDRARRQFSGALGAAAVGLVWSAPAASADVVRVGGVGSLTPVLRLLGEAFAKAHPGATLQVVDPPLGSAGGVRAVQAGQLDVAFSGRTLNDREKGELQPWMRTPLVLASSDASVSGLTLAEVARIYSGEQTLWPDGRPIRLVMRSHFESETQVLQSLSPAVKQAVDRALARRDLPVADNDLSALELLVKLKGSLGSTSLGLIVSAHAALKPLPLDGAQPTLNNLVSGRYPWHRPYFTVHAPESINPVTKAFLAFIRSERARTMLATASYAVHG